MDSWHTWVSYQRGAGLLITMRLALRFLLAAAGFIPLRSLRVTDMEVFREGTFLAA